MQCSSLSCKSSEKSIRETRGVDGADDERGLFFCLVSAFLNHDGGDENTGCVSSSRMLTAGDSVYFGAAKQRDHYG